MRLGLCYYLAIRNKTLPSSGSKQNLPRIFARGEKPSFTKHLNMLDEFVRSETEAVYSFFSPCPSQVHGTVHIFDMLSDFYPSGRSTIGKWDLKKLLKMYFYGR